MFEAVPVAKIQSIAAPAFRIPLRFLGTEALIYTQTSQPFLFSARTAVQTTAISMGCHPAMPADRWAPGLIGPTDYS
ncbi:MAG: hypothetical protein P8X90_12680 [Desulfobacterales bacterium]